MVRIGMDTEIDARRSETGHEDLIVKTGVIDDRGALKQEYHVLPGANRHAVDYVIWGSMRSKELFEKEKEAGIYRLPQKRECPLARAQA